MAGAARISGTKKPPSLGCGDRFRGGSYAPTGEDNPCPAGIQALLADRRAWAAATLAGRSLAWRPAGPWRRGWGSGKGGDRRSEEFQAAEICALNGETRALAAEKSGLGSHFTYERMSQRKAAKMLGVGKGTVQRALDQKGPPHPRRPAPNPKPVLPPRQGSARWRWR